MPRYGIRNPIFFPRNSSFYWLIDILIDVGIIAVLIALLFVAMPFVLLLLLLFGVKYFMMGAHRRYYGRRW